MSRSPLCCWRLPQRSALPSAITRLKSQARLRWRSRDDDAVMNATWLRDMGATYVLLADLDKDSRTLHGPIDTLPPTIARLRSSIARLNTAIDRARRAGQRTDFYFFYSGHGSVQEAEGYVWLADGKFYRNVFLELIALIDADQVHVVVDACNSYYLVHGRGEQVRRRTPHIIIEDSVPIPKKAGFFLSTSAAADSHEWSAVQGGVFSHEVRSGLRGGADVDRDGSISYEELAAFVHRANRAVRNPKYRPQFHVRPPRGLGLAQASIVRQLPKGLFEIDQPLGLHMFIEDRFGRRYLDVHPDVGHPANLLLPRIRPLFVRTARRRLEYMLDASGQRLSDLSKTTFVPRRRGSEHLAFRRLFRLPFSQNSVAEYRAARVAEPTYARVQRRPTWPRYALGLTSLALAGSGVGFTVAAENTRASALRMPQEERVEARDRVDFYNGLAIGMYSAAGLGVAMLLAHWLWPEDDDIDSAIRVSGDDASAASAEGLHALPALRPQEVSFRP